MTTKLSVEQMRAAVVARRVDMEAAAVAARALQWRLPFFCVRVVTDGAD